MEQLIDRLIEKNISFALYRRPSESSPVFAVEDERGIEQMESLGRLNGRSGVVIAPFRPDKRHPIVLLPAERLYRGWTKIEDAAKAAASAAKKHTSPVTTASDSGEVSETELRDSYDLAFGRFMKGLDSGEMSKLVLSRSATYTVSGNLSPLKAYVSACERYPRLMISLTYTPYTGIWIGCSPEIILQGNAGTWETVALAGTTPVPENGDPVWSEKNRKEQAYVSTYIRNVLEDYASELRENGPETVLAGEIAHLKSDFTFKVRDTSRIGDLLNALHPTPAVCGVPKQTAFRFISENEGYDREYYSGITGWLQPEGETFLYVNLRCARISGRKLSFFAGGGILQESDAESEWKETQYKMNTMKKFIFHK